MSQQRVNVMKSDVLVEEQSSSGAHDCNRSTRPVVTCGVMAAPMGHGDRIAADVAHNVTVDDQQGSVRTQPPPFEAQRVPQYSGVSLSRLQAELDGWYNRDDLDTELVSLRSLASQILDEAVAAATAVTADLNNAEPAVARRGEVLERRA